MRGESSNRRGHRGVVNIHQFADLRNDQLEMRPVGLTEQVLHHGPALVAQDGGCFTDGREACLNRVCGEAGGGVAHEPLQDRLELQPARGDQLMVACDHQRCGLLVDELDAPQSTHVSVS